MGTLTSKHGKAHSWLQQDDSAMQLFSAMLYAVVATSMSLINRFALLLFPLPTIVLLVQMVATLAILYPLLLARVLTFAVFRPTRLVQLLGVGVLYTANTAFALFGLKAINLPMYTAIKRLTPAATLVIKAVWKRRWPKASLTCSVMLVVVGCVIAGLGDLAFDPWGYAFCLSSVVMQALYLLLVEFQGDAGATSTSELLWYNAIIALPLLTVITAANGDFFRVPAAAAKGLANPRGALYFCSLVLGAATLGTALNYSMFLCTLHNSALTTTIVGVLRGVATVLLGFLLDTVPFSPLNVAGITLNTAGGVWYSWIKFKEKQAGASSSSGSSRAAEKLSLLSARSPDHASGREEGASGVDDGSSDVSWPLLDGGGSGKLSVRVTGGHS